MVYFVCDMLQDYSGKVGGLKVDAVDTTGAGDAFVAGLLSQLAADSNLIQVMFMYPFFFIYRNYFLYQAVSKGSLIHRTK